MIDAHHGWNKSFKPLFLGFILSLILTFAAYLFAVKGMLPKDGLLFIVVGIAFIQAIIQFIYFFHLGAESKPRWNLMIFLFMTLVLFLIVVGSLWIMYHLDYNMMPDMKSYP